MSSRCNALAGFTLRFIMISIAVCALFVAGCTTGPLSTMDRHRSSQSDGPGSLDIVAGHITETAETEPILPDEPEIRIPQADRAMVETLEDRGLNVRYTERGVVVTLADLVFEFGSTRLTSDAQRKLRSVAKVLLNEARGRAVAVEGHTDSIGAELYNQGLSERRAVSVADSLSTHGVSDRLVTTRGYGSQYPIAPNEFEDGGDNPQGRTLNRRVEIVIAN